MDRLQALGIVTAKEIPDIGRIEVLFQQLEDAFNDPNVHKEQIVEIMKDYLPNFEHIETGKSLDSKM